MRALFKISIIIVLLVSIAFFTLSSDFFSLKNIYVTGNKTISKDDIISLSSLQYGQNIFRINKKKIIKYIFNNSRIKAVRVRRVMPSGVSLDIIEREAIAAIPYLGSYLSIDEEGLILAVTGLSADIGVPMVEGFDFSDFKIGEIIKPDNDEQLEIVINILNLLKGAELSKEIKILNVKDLNNIEMITETDIKVIFINESLDYKIHLAKSIIDDLIRNEKKGTIDMRHEGNPIFKENKLGG